ncbi:hypothetical protein EDD28_2821 [Salana multivorans]|uniref:DNA primase n=1 Tax=Salana multivorans TaxID=120377 RepID=A0A3N2D184_9MICO|nr:DNA primase [Salana multivorans]OJX94224.1 MAG: DNA primase [Micrococcales bacterium 73-15]ROR93408.1 hypothetical protein EDD28_2821 [Salana multivorans]
MATDPRAALDRLIAAFEVHLEAARVASDPDAAAVLDAAATLADAFDTYDDALYTAYGVDTPFDVYDEDDDDDDDLEDDEDDLDFEDDDED